MSEWDCRTCKAYVVQYCTFHRDTLGTPERWHYSISDFQSNISANNLQVTTTQTIICPTTHGRSYYCLISLTFSILLLLLFYTTFNFASRLHVAILLRVVQSIKVPVSELFLQIRATLSVSFIIKHLYFSLGRFNSCIIVLSVRVCMLFYKWEWKSEGRNFYLLFTATGT